MSPLQALASGNTLSLALQNIKFDNTLGAILIGALVSTALFGLTTLQTYLYFFNYPNDRTSVKWLVAVLWVLDFTHSIFVSHSLYHFLVKEYGNPLALMQGEWSIIAEVGITLPVTLLVQGFMAYRVYMLSYGNWLLTGPIVLMSLAHTAIGFVCVAKFVEIRFFYRLPEVIGFMSATLVIMAANDLFTTATLCWLLYKAQSSFAETRSKIRLLIVYTIETGLLTSIFVTVDAICVFTMPRNWIFIGITACISKLYSNSLLTMFVGYCTESMTEGAYNASTSLNSRHSLQSKTDLLSTKLTTSNKSSSYRNSHYVPPLRMQDISIRTEKDVQVELMKPNEAFVGPSHPTNQFGFAM